MASKPKKRHSTSSVIREMKIKTTMRFQFTPTRMAIIKKADNKKCWWRCGEIVTLTHCWWECIMLQPLWKTVAVSQKWERINIWPSKKKQESSRKTSTSVLLTMPNPLTVWITTNCGKFLKRWEYKTKTLPASWEICIQVKKQQLEPDMEQQTGSKQEKEYVKAMYCHSACLTYMQSTTWEMPGWMKHKVESRLAREISITSDTQMTPPLWQKSKKN